MYWLCARDSTGAYLDGGRTYKLSVPLPVIDKLFWSITVYDADTRTEIVTDQRLAALRSLVELTPEVLGEAAQAELYFGPERLDDAEGRWIKTIPGKGWFVYFRIYGPDAAATVDANRGRLSASPERLTSNQELCDLQGKPHGVTRLWTASNPGSGTSFIPANEHFLEAKKCLWGQDWGQAV